MAPADWTISPAGRSEGGTSRRGGWREEQGCEVKDEGRMRSSPVGGRGSCCPGGGRKEQGRRRHRYEGLRVPMRQMWFIFWMMTDTYMYLCVNTQTCRHTHSCLIKPLTCLCPASWGRPPNPWNLPTDRSDSAVYHKPWWFMLAKWLLVGPRDPTWVSCIGGDSLPLSHQGSP